MSVNKKFAFGLGKGVLNIDLHLGLVWREKWLGPCDGGRTSGPHATCICPLSSQTLVCFSTLAFKGQLLGFIIVGYRLVAKSCQTLWNPMDCIPPGSSVYGISQAKYWGGLPFPSARDLPDSGIEPVSLALAGRFFTTGPPGVGLFGTWEEIFLAPCLELHVPQKLYSRLLLSHWLMADSFCNS